MRTRVYPSDKYYVELREIWIPQKQNYNEQKRCT